MRSQAAPPKPSEHAHVWHRELLPQAAPPAHEVAQEETLPHWHAESAHAPRRHVYSGQVGWASWHR
jgi:hypothetical protein